VDPQWPVESWEAGTDQIELRRLARHWAMDFDWRAYKGHIDALPWVTAELDGTPLSYLRFNAERAGGCCWS
jgi:hypothetical protein